MFPEVPENPVWKLPDAPGSRELQELTRKTAPSNPRKHDWRCTLRMLRSCLCTFLTRATSLTVRTLTPIFPLKIATAT